MAQAEGAKPKKKVVAQTQSAVSEDLVMLIQGLKDEMQTLRSEIQQIRESKPVQPAADLHLPEAEAIFESMIGQMTSVCNEDLNLLGDEIAFALENPETEPESIENSDLGVQTEEETQLTTEELDALIEATSKLNEAEDSMASESDMMSEDDIAALLAGTGTHVSELSPESAEPETPPSPFAEADDSVMTAEEIEALLSGASNLETSSESQESTAGQMLSQDEIQKLLSIPTQSDSPAEPEAAEIVSAEEIQAMLGLKVPDEQSEPSLVSEDELLEMQKVKIEEMSPEVLEVDAAPATEVQFDQINESAIALIQGITAARALAVPICVIDSKLHCIGLEPYDEESIAELSQESGHEIVMHPGSIEKILSEIRLRYSPSDDQDLWRNRIKAFAFKWPQIGRKTA